MVLSNRDRELQWKRGIHTNQHDKEVAITEMRDDHLRRTLDMFRNLKVKPLRREYRKRWRPRIEEVIDFMQREALFTAPTEKEQKVNLRATRAKKALEKYLSLKL
jgi:hypothetical protein